MNDQTDNKATIKPALPKGMRDFNAAQIRKRRFILDAIVSTYELFGFEPLETPAMEKLLTLTGKYGEEGDRLLFKVLNSGDWLVGADAEALATGDAARLLSDVAGKGLRYDLTVPFARHVVMNRHQIPMPYKRYQIQPVWRADRPQKGRYREFWQCDVDVIGSDSLLNEAELLQIYDWVFGQLNMSVQVKINNRKLLNGLTEAIGAEERFTAIVTAMDKLDKVGIEGVRKLLSEMGLNSDQLEALEEVMRADGDNDQRLAVLQARFETAPDGVSEIGMRGLEEMRELLELAAASGLRHIKPEFDPTLARGLSYYTGTIFEVVHTQVGIGSLSGGGRYDDLTGIFGMPGMSGVGISFGLDRLYDVLESTGWPDGIRQTGTVIALIPFEKDGLTPALKCLAQLRERGIPAEIYPDVDAKMKKKMKYVDARGIPYAGLLGSQEIADGVIALKNMASGEQKTLSPDQLADELSSL